MAGIRVTDIVCDLLNFAVTAHKQQFFCLGDPVTGQIFIDRAPKIAHKQARQILGGYIDVAAELFGGQILHVVCFHQLKHGLDVFFPQGIAGICVEKSIGKLQQQCITVAGKLVCIDGCCFYSRLKYRFACYISPLGNLFIIFLILSQNSSYNIYLSCKLLCILLILQNP